MSRYRKVEVRIWSDERFRLMSDRGKLAFLFLLTHPHMTGLGAMRASAPGLAAELGWTEKAFREAFTEALSKGIAKYDENACFLWLPKFLKHNKPESPNVVRSWAAHMDTLPECNMKNEVAQHVKGFTEGLPEAFRKAFREYENQWFPNSRTTFANQEQEHKQEQEHDNTPLPPKGGGTASLSLEVGPGRSPKVSGESVAIPENLRTDAFTAAWAAWLAEKRDRGQLLTKRGWEAQLTKLAGFGPVVATKAINDSLANGWQGLFPEKVQDVGTGITHGGGRAGGQQTLLDREQQRESEQLGTIRNWIDKRTVQPGGLREVDGAPLRVEADGSTDRPAT